MLRCTAHVVTITSSTPSRLRTTTACRLFLPESTRAEREYEPDPDVGRERTRLAAELQRWQTASDEELARVALSDEIAKDIAVWASDTAEQRRAWRALSPAALQSAGGVTLTREADATVFSTGAQPPTDTYTVTVQPTISRVTAVQIEVLADPRLPAGGPGRASNGNLHLTEIRMVCRPRGASGGERQLEIARAFADFNQQGWSVAGAIDKNPKTAWGVHPQEGKSHQAVFVLAAPLTSADELELSIELEQSYPVGHLFGKFRVSVTGNESPAVSEAQPETLAVALETPHGERSAAQHALLARRIVLDRARAALSRLPSRRKVYAATTEFPPDGNFVPAKGPRAVHVLARGDIHSPLRPAEPGALSCVEDLQARFTLDNSRDEGERRAALARWLSARANHRTWRSIANRLWHYHFGRGLVRTPNDFGKMGDHPSHPELLDHLAVLLRDGGESLKAFHRQILLSSTYRQSSADRVEQAALDSEVKLLWRMPRRRLEAESVRDTILQLSGAADWKMGGPSAQHFTMKPGVHVTPIVNYKAFDVDSPASFRRSVYRFVFRTIPDPFLETLDCPDGSELTPVRGSSLTALQALAMLNNRFVVRQSVRIAERLESMSTERSEQIEWLWTATFARSPTEGEVAAVLEYAERHGMANACRFVLNTNEFLFVE